MEQEQKNRFFLVFVVITLLITVFVVGIMAAVRYNDKLLREHGYIFKQVYYSEYTLDMIDEDYYIGYLNEKEINVIINKAGKEVFNNGVGIYYDGVFKTKEGNYLIYNNRDNHLVLYSFNGESLDKIADISDVSQVKPILYTNHNIEYIVGFSSNVDGSLKLYMLNDSGIISIPHAIFLPDEEKSGNYYVFSDNYLVVENDDDLCAVYDFFGNRVIDYEYKEIMNTFNNSFIVKNTKNKYGIVDVNNKELLKIKYKVVDLYDSNYLVVEDNNLAIFSADYKNLTGFKMKYNNTVDYDLRSTSNSINLWIVGNNYVVVNNYLDDLNDIKYPDTLAYFVKNNKVAKKVKQIGFNNNGLVYSYNDEYEIKFYDSELEETGKIKLKNVSKILSIDKVSTTTIKISYLDDDDEEKIQFKYYRNNKKTDFKYGDVLYFNEYYEIVYREGKDVTIYNTDMRKIDSLEGEHIVYKNGYLIVDNGIYKVEKKG